MASDNFEVRVSLRKLLIGLLLTVGPLALVGIVTISRADQALEKTIGTHFRIMAEATAADVAQFIHDRVVDVVALGADPLIVDAVTAANRAYAGMSPEAIQEKIARIEKSWNTPAVNPLVAEMLGSRASRLLNRHRELDRRLLRLTLTDERGAAIAATHKTFDYYQADEEFWQAIYANGRGAVNLTDILYDEVTKSNYIGVGVPVVEEGSNRFIGALDALVDVTTMFPSLQRAQAGGTRVLLVKSDGTVIYAPNVSLSMNLKSDEYAAIRDAAPNLRTGYLNATLAGAGPTLIGFAATGLEENYKNLGWTVLVTQSSQQAFAPIRGVVRLIAFVVLVGILGVTFLGVYFALHRKRVFTEIGDLEKAPPVHNTPA
jgi:hypothetical protein